MSDATVKSEKLSIFRRIAGFFRGVKAEYSKIVFPTKDDLKKQTIATVVLSIIIGLLIFALDVLMKFLLGFIL